MTDDVLKRALKELETNEKEAIQSKLSRSKVFCKVLLWLIQKFRSTGAAHSGELAKYMKVTITRARAILQDFEDLGLVGKKSVGIIVEYIPILNNSHMIIEEYTNTALMLCGISAKTARLDEFKVKRGMK